MITQSRHIIKVNQLCNKYKYYSGGGGYGGGGGDLGGGYGGGGGGGHGGGKGGEIFKLDVKFFDPSKITP